MLSASEDLISFIMDAEIVATDPNNGAIKPFQDLAGRARKDVNLKDVKVAVCVYAFDLMYFNQKVRYCPWLATQSSYPAQSLLELTFRERRDLLRNSFVSRKAPQEDLSLAFFDFVESRESLEGRTSIEEFLLKAVGNRCEGLMIKVCRSVTAKLSL
jgi:DNA ligase-1